MELQCSDVAMENSNTNRTEAPTLIKDLHPEYISATLHRRWDEIKEQSSTALKPNELHEQMEPIILSIYNGQLKGFHTKYVMETTLSHTSFQIRSPTYTHVQLMPFTIFLQTRRRQKRTNSPRNYRKYIVLQG